jgi:redox-sensitive bicupin YhaK (pirin superfamily)
MSNQEADPGEVVCAAGGTPPGVEVLTPREVPLGGPRAMRVRRTLPQRHRSLIGAWCFVDHYGPDEVATSGGMSVAPHPHTGLQTVSWLFAGEIEHRDSAGNEATVRPGEVNLMTAGRGISHSEVSTAGTDVLHGAQLWVALPEAARDVAPGFQHHAPEPVRGPGWEARVFLGSLLGVTSPVQTHTPLLGAEIMVAPGATLGLDVDPGFEHGVLVDTGLVGVSGSADGPTETKPGDLAFLARGRERIELTAYDEARVLLLGGTPLGESIVMWWNFVGRSHEEIVAFREAWQTQIADRTSATGNDERPAPAEAGGLEEPGGPGVAVVPDGQDVRPGRFGVVVGEHLPPIPAPPLPNARLKERR